MVKLHRARIAALAVLSALLAVPTAKALAQNATITGKVTSEFGQPLEGVNVYITELSISIPTNAAGVYNMVIPAARVSGQAVTLRARAVGYLPLFKPLTVRAGSQTIDFALKPDLNRLSEVVVTGSIEGTERALVPFAVSRLTAADIPVPALDPLRALQGKVAGMRVAQTNGKPGQTPDILLRGPTSINSNGRSTGPLIIVDGTIQRVGSLQEVGGLDIESVEVVKGAAGASLYGSTAANGVIIIKTKRGASRDGVHFNFRSEYGVSDVSSLDYGQPVNHHLQLDETGKRFCVQGSANIASCSRTFDWNTEILRINNVNADTVRTPQNSQFNAPGAAGGELLNVFQSNSWPGQYYNTFAQVAAFNPVALNSIDATGKAGSVRYFVSGAFTSDKGAIRGLNGQEERRARLNLDYDVRPNWTVSISSLYNRGTTDLRSGGSSNGSIFGQLLRGAPAGTNYLLRDTLGRAIVRGGGAGLRGTGNGGGTFLYDAENLVSSQLSQRFLGSVSSSYFPADWVTFDGSYSYDTRQQTNNSHEPKGYRTFTTSTSDNFGNQSIGNRNEESMNASLSATFRKQVTSELNAKINFRSLYDQDVLNISNGTGDTYVVKDIFTLSNLVNNVAASSSSQTIRNMGLIGGANIDFKGRYILDGTYRYDGSSLFGSGNRWAPFGRLSGVWRLSEEPWFHVPGLSDIRFRASRGSAGNTPSFSAQYETYSCGKTGCSLGQAGNSKLKPETTTETELGTDFTLFGRLGVEFTKADNSTKNQILNVPTQASLGFASQWQNAGVLANHTYEVALNLPLITTKDLQWSVRGTYDRTRTFIDKLFIPEYYQSAGTGQGTGSLFLITADRTKLDGVQKNRYGNIYGRKFYKNCGDMPSTVQASCGDGKAYQVNDQGWVVWTGAGNSWKDGITKNLWQTSLSKTDSPWNYPLSFGAPIVDRPLRGQPGEGTGITHILGNSLPDFRTGINSTLTYKRISLYGLIDATIGHKINNQGEAWGLVDFSSSYFDQGGKTVETAKPIGYGWRVGGSEGAGSGGFYDILGPNNYNVESGSYAKLREVSAAFRIGKIGGVGDWTVSLVGRNLFTITKYSGYDPEVGVSGGNSASLVNQVDAFNFPTLRTYTMSISTRF
ncbi:MAG: SusC/RagA family TonB-linked outer membrane protein [Gemmatimonadaceae bacterium]